MVIGLTPPARGVKPPAYIRMADVCYKTSEQIQGTTKICLYDCGGATYYQSVNYLASCPGFINR
jgi:hypothetical protein